MGYDVVRTESAGWEERPGQEGQQPRQAADVTGAAGLTDSRARLWRYPAHTRGRRHREDGQEEVFVCLRGTLTMLLGEPPERVEVGPRGVVAVEQGTPLQARNEGDEELVLFVYGAPPEQAGADFLDGVEI